MTKPVLEQSSAFQGEGLAPSPYAELRAYTAEVETELEALKTDVTRFHHPDCPHRHTVLIGNCCENNDTALGAMLLKSELEAARRDRNSAFTRRYEAEAKLEAAQDDIRRLNARKAFDDEYIEALKGEIELRVTSPYMDGYEVAKEEYRDYIESLERRYEALRKLAQTMYSDKYIKEFIDSQ